MRFAGYALFDHSLRQAIIPIGLAILPSDAKLNGAGAFKEPKTKAVCAAGYAGEAHRGAGARCLSRLP